jgi:hypothetical protein
VAVILPADDWVQIEASVLIAQINRADFYTAVSSAPQRNDCSEVERARKHKSVIIVGVLTDQVYPPWRECDDIGIAIKGRAKPGGCTCD